MKHDQDMHDVTEMGALVRGLRKSMGLTLQDLASRAGTGIRFLSEFERGKKTAELGKVLDVFAALGANLGVTNMPLPATGPAGKQDRDPTDARQPSAAGIRVPDGIGARPARGGDAGRLWDMLRAAVDLREILARASPGTALTDDVITRRGIERCAEVLGEAARRVSPGTQATLSMLPWRELIARRNQLVMEYDRVNLGEMCEAIAGDLPALITQLESALDRLGSD